MKTWVETIRNNGDKLVDGLTAMGKNLSRQLADVRASCNQITDVLTTE
jgi:hypothetical protein